MYPSRLSIILIISTISISSISHLAGVLGHGRLIEPPSRASAWRYGFDTPHNYNDHELFCGGFTRQWVKNEGKCGVCGDAWDAKSPRAHEYGGAYGKGVIVRKYGVGSVVNIRVELTANHYGYFEFSICPDYKTTTQKCLDGNILKLVKPQDDAEHNLGTRYFPKDGNRIYEIKYRMPKQKCEHCLLQWRYIAGNNWGTCPNGTGAVGCGPQEEFRACADIEISGKSSDDNLLPPPPESTVAPPHHHQESYNPITSLIISFASFLVVFLIFSLLYIHFYQVGKQLKTWIKGSSDLKQPPMPPPRVKKIKQTSSSDETDESLA